MTKKIQKWFLENEPSTDLIYHPNWWKNNIFIRDRIIPLLSNREAEIINTHLSKSIVCPVIKTVYKDVEILWQYNFYSWQIMVKSYKPLNLENLDFYFANGNYFYYQGIPSNYQFKKYSKKNNKKFAINISSEDELDVWGFALELRRVIDKGDK